MNLLRIFGWKFHVGVTLPDKCVICVAPHTSNWDFILGLIAYRSIGRDANFLMKDFWFFWPMKYLLKALGGIPVYRRRKDGPSLTAQVIQRFNEASYLNLAVTPEGTRSVTDKWKTGFLYIAIGAKVPVCLGVIDYKRKLISIDDMFTPTGDVEADLRFVRAYYAAHAQDAAKYPSKFIP